ncbi:NAD(P)H-binding protein [Flavimarina sp. Hel_I_48]|uniref:NmrA family NAD(P)-binding protein n=1 Tax=Flavimarina sp. Hel_I_48 TaxID=1392488 RepID=UPI0004DFAC26|nr:NAD(P)H-binding protein [Flavimarina sp. Hel_I_48]
MKIVLTGSLGHISHQIAEKLVKDHDVTIISSSEDRKKEIEDLGATAAIGSLKDAEFLTEAFSKADAVYCMVPPNHFTEPNILLFYRKVGSNYCEAIQRAGVKRVVHLSSIGAHLDKGTGPILGSHALEQMFDQVPDIVLTHMRPTSFYYNLNSFKETIKEHNAIFANYGEDKVPMASTEDIANAIAEELVKMEDVPTYRYVSSDERNGDEIADVLGKAIGKPDLKWKIISDEEMQQGMQASGMPEHIAMSLVDLYASIRSGKLAEEYERQKPQEMGKVKLEDFAKAFAKDF